MKKKIQQSNIVAVSCDMEGWHTKGGLVMTCSDVVDT